MGPTVSGAAVEQRSALQCRPIRNLLQTKPGLRFFSISDYPRVIERACCPSVKVGGNVKISSLKRSHPPCRPSDKKAPNQIQALEQLQWKLNFSFQLLHILWIVQCQCQWWYSYLTRYYHTYLKLVPPLPQFFLFYWILLKCTNPDKIIIIRMVLLFKNTKIDVSLKAPAVLQQQN